MQFFSSSPGVAPLRAAARLGGRLGRGTNLRGRGQGGSRPTDGISTRFSEETHGILMMLVDGWWSMVVVDDDDDDDDDAYLLLLLVVLSSLLSLLSWFLLYFNELLMIISFCLSLPRWWASDATMFFGTQPVVPAGAATGFPRWLARLPAKPRSSDEVWSTNGGGTGESCHINNI